MPIPFRDFLDFRFNSGKGIRADQIADVDVPKLQEKVGEIDQAVAAHDQEINDLQNAETGTVLPEHEQVQKLGLFSKAGKLFWELINQVPNTPGEQSAVGHVLTVYGTNDQDYRWEAAPENTGGDGDSGGTTEIPDNSIEFVKVLADTQARKLGWRGKIEASNISAGADLPAIADVRLGDIRIITQDVADGLSFVDISDTGTVVESAKSTDIIMAIQLRVKTWVRLGNIFEGHRALMAVTELQSSEVPHFTTYPDKYYRFNDQHVFTLNLHGIDTRDPALNDVDNLRILVQGSLVANILNWTTATGDRAINIVIGKVMAENINNNRVNPVIIQVNMYAGNYQVPENFRKQINFSMPVVNANQRPARLQDITDRYTDAEKQKVATIKNRFDQPVGASGTAGNVPEGTHTIQVEITRGGIVYFKNYPVSRLAAARRYEVELANPSSPAGGKDIYMDMTYVSATRTLTYATAGINNSVINSIRAIGEV